MPTQPHRAVGSDAGFLRRVYVASIVVTLFVGAVAALYVTPRWGAGFATAGLWSIVNFRALEMLLRLSVRPSGRDPVAIAVAALIKIPVLYGVGAVLAVKGGFPPIALILGFSVPLAVIVLKVGGQILAPRAALTDRGSRAAGIAFLVVLSALTSIPGPGARNAWAQHGGEEQGTTAVERGEGHGQTAVERGEGHGETAVEHAQEHGEAAAGHGEQENGEQLELPNLIMLLFGFRVIDEHSAVGHWVHVFENTFFAAIVGAFLSIVSITVYRRRQDLPGRLQAFLEIVVEQVDKMATIILGRYARDYVPFVGTIFIYLLFMNYFALVPLGKASTSTFLNNISIALCVFLYVQYTGIRKNGLLGYLHHLMGSPRDLTGWLLSPLMLFLEIFGELIKPISLSLRLFGNIFGEDMLLAIFALLGVVVVSAVGVPFVGIPLHVPFMLLSLLLGFIQALVFALLATVYISLMLPHEHGEH
jgi:F-type H+-transporting ATPase subunit a